jgi:hypothetical protein
LPGFDRVHVYDPFGNRLEFMQQQALLTAGHPRR